MANDVLTEVKFWSIVIANQEKKAVLCNPEHESRIKTWVDVRGLSHLITVTASPQCPIDRVYVMKDQDWWPNDAAGRFAL